MARPLREESNETAIAGLQRRERQLRNRGPGGWMTIGSESPTWAPAWQNSFAAAPAPYAAPAYRHGTHWELEFKGHVDVSDAVSDTVAWTMDLDHRPTEDISFITDVLNGVGFSLARMHIDSESGDVTFTWPAT